MFAMPPSKRNDFHTPVPNIRDRESNRALEVLALVVFPYLADLSGFSRPRIRNEIGRMAKVGIEVMILDAFLWTVRHSVVTRLATDYGTLVYGKDGVLIRVSHSTVLRCFSMGIFSVLRSIYCDPVLAFWAIAWIAEVDWDTASKIDLPMNMNHCSSFSYSWILV